MASPLSLLDEYEGRLAQAVNREELLACAERIPQLPHVVANVLKLLENPDSNAGQLANAILSDPGLTSALLKLANSAFFGQSGSISSAEQAVMTVGFANLRSLVLVATLRGMTKRDTADQIVWENALATAMIGRRLAETVVRHWADEIFLAGLLHGLGQFILLANIKTRAAYPRVLRRIREAGVDYITAELEEIGFSHPLLGALAASRWNFPVEVCHTILHYHDPLEGIDTPADRKLALVKLADLVAHAAGLGHPEGFPTDLETMQQLARWLGLIRPAGEVLPALIGEAQDHFLAASQLWSN